MKKFGVIGVGNPLRSDDGIGIILLEKLIGRKDELPNGIEYVDGGTGGMNLLHVLTRFDVVLIIDAVNFDGNAGESRLFKLDDVNSKKISATVSTHETDILKILQLSKELDEIPSDLFIFGIQPKDTSHGHSLSQELKEGVELHLKNLRKEIVAIFNREKDRGMSS